MNIRILHHNKDVRNLDVVSFFRILCNTVGPANINISDEKKTNKPSKFEMDSIIGNVVDIQLYYHFFTSKNTYG